MKSRKHVREFGIVTNITALHVMRFHLCPRCFYYNAVTAVSQWERPTTPAAFFATNDGEQTTQLGPSYHDNHHSDAEGSIKDGYIAPCDGNDETAKAGTHAVILPID